MPGARPAPPRPRPGRGAPRALAAAAAATAVVVAGATPAAADPPRPTDHRSTVTDVDPPVDGLEVRVVGGDAFLEITVAEGHEVVVEGYGEEPYLRVLEDGTVERNRRSPATYLNEDREGAVALPAAADAEAEPEWERVAGGGTYAWHDHRIHWMGGGDPPGAEPGAVVQEWTVPMTVDGTPVEVRGELVVADEVGPVPWVGLALAAGALVVAAGTRRRSLATRVAAGSALATGVAAVVVAWSTYRVAPPGSGASPVPVVVPAVGAVAAAAGVVPRAGSAGVVATLAAAAALAGWGVLRAEVLWTPVLPTELPFAVDRAVTALALGVPVAGAAVVLWAGGLAAAGRPARPNAPEPG